MKNVIFGLLSLFSLNVFAQERAADFTHLDATVAITPEKGQISGDLVYTFDILKPSDTIYIDARKMAFQEVLLNDKEVEFVNDQKRLGVVSDFQPSEDNKLQIKYSATPEQAMYFIKTTAESEEPEYQVWTQGQGKYTSNWLPSFDDTTEKLEFDLTIDYPSENAVLANGRLVDATAPNDSITRWKFDMKNQMSSYLAAIAAGNFKKTEAVSEGGVEMAFYYPEGYKEYVEPTYRHSVELMDFIEKKIGVPFPWQNYKQVPVQDFLYAGMENTGTTIFSDILVVDSTGYKDRNYVNVNAHELAHQWFGDLVTAASGEHHWLQEGFATYYALLAEKEIFGEDYFYWKLYQSAEDLKEMSDSGKGESLMNPKASSLTFYQKGAWALHTLNELVGEKAFDQAVKNYLEKNKFGSVTTEDFIQEVEKTSGKDLSGFVQRWLKQSAFQGTEALKSLKKSDFILDYLEVAALKQLPLEQKKDLLKRALEFPVNDYVGQEVVHQLALEDPSEVIDLYKKAFLSNNLYVRQAIAMSLQNIPKELKSQYESLLQDDSYVTKEAALFNLWVNFPEERKEYLERVEGVEGFLDKNVRTLWLALKIATPGINTAEKQGYLQELSSYTAPHHRFQLRQNAFNLLLQLQAFRTQNVKDLLQATSHHNYRFREFAKDLLQKLKTSGMLSTEDQALLEKR